MAKLKMKKIELIAMLTDSKKIIELLQRRGVVEISRNDDEELENTNVTAVVGEFDKFRNTAVQALDIIDNYAPEKASITDMFSGKTEVEKHEFGREAMQMEKVMSAANEIIKNQRLITDSANSISQLEIKCDMLQRWLPLDVPLNFKGTATTSAYIGTLPYQITAESLEDQLPDNCSVEVVSGSKEQTNLFILCSKSSYDEAGDVLRRLAFVSASEPESHTPLELISMYEQEISDLEKGTDEAKENIEKLAENRKELRFVIDYLQMRKEKYDALSGLGFTESTFVLTGYIPEKYCEQLRKEIEAKYTASITFTDPTDDDDVPVLLENSSFSSPVEGITKMYALPGKGDVDPTPVMSFFYYLFFGMMLSDAGYGLLMLIGTTIALKKFKLETSMRKTLTMFRNCGISTIFWGALFGSWFGDIAQVVARNFFDKEIGSLALWFEPLTDPVKLLLVSFGLGILHLLLGVAVSFKMTWDTGKKLDAIFDALPIYLIVIGVAPIGAGMFISVPSALTNAGLYMLIAGVVILVLTAGRTSKSVFGKFFGGLYALYNTATGYLGDILSYSRLLALGLATGSIASVINLIGTMPENKVFKLILLIIVFVVGHTANLAINLLGAYVHTDRLQFVELFSKFYTGGGREFTPLTVNTKYIKFKEENTND
ncbi:V/A-type H+-transporting ATPase subunit I [Ruminococcus flavefaciens]|uniref:V/A-type H+-transporting ATPase subunit I n=1 Tax=Ruminococcus flavefaciens TaxID=1265 RepID=A0A1H6HNX7_RUMFL|nr:V-type ATP synthase subunit I [Ruminococcus flavefaciens]SEH37547.1 V/A-type H+-transporting ATPase subunit I [Ruminococcus flavefaciens]